jgi:hypothetical protein
MVAIREKQLQEKVNKKCRSLKVGAGGKQNGNKTLKD